MGKMTASSLKQWHLLLVILFMLIRAEGQLITADERAILEEPNRLEPSVCTAQDDSNQTGECVSLFRCKRLKGRISGWCPSNITGCCILTTDCDTEVDNIVTYFTNPGFPKNYSKSSVCSLRVKKLHKNVSQMRLDFDNFTLATAGVSSGYCDTDSLVVTGGKARDFTICGSYSGKHLYYNVLDSENSVTIKITLAQANLTRLWNIKITQIGSMERTPAECIQYHTDVEGTAQMMDVRNNGQHLAYQDYLICIRQAKDACSVLYQSCGDGNTIKINRPLLSGNAKPVVMRMPYTKDDRKHNPEDHLGSCITYQQQMCLP